MGASRQAQNTPHGVGKVSIIEDIIPRFALLPPCRPPLFSGKTEKWQMWIVPGGQVSADTCTPAGLAWAEEGGAS